MVMVNLPRSGLVRWPNPAVPSLPVDFRYELRYLELAFVSIIEKIGICRIKYLV